MKIMHYRLCPSLLAFVAMMVVNHVQYFFERIDR
jgi:hypothetical protein